MATPRTRSEFKEYCLRRLGHPVIQINVDEDQLDDRVDDAHCGYARDRARGNRGLISWGKEGIEYIIS
jgi:hypothetical protein